jgi:CubicO group peptidase (beta-lactamase class C family)
MDAHHKPSPSEIWPPSGSNAGTGRSEQPAVARFAGYGGQGGLTLVSRRSLVTGPALACQSLAAGPSCYRNCMIVRLVAVACCVLALAKPPNPASQSTRASLADAAKAAAGIPRLHSLIVSHRGTIVLEHYDTPRAKGLSNIKSASKSIISALVGIAIERGAIKGVEQPVADYFPELRKDPDARKGRITIEDLLTMRSGMESTSFDNYGEWVKSRNWVRFVLDRPLITDPGTELEYSTGSTHLLSAILTKATRRDTWTFAQETLGQPLGITLARWARDPQGIYFGGNEMLMTPRQMLAFGELYLNNGRTTAAGPKGGQARQVVPARWVEISCKGRGRSRFNPDQLYGYGWWLRDFGGEESCFAWGYGGQYILLFRDLDLVIVTTSATTVSEDRRDYRQAIFDLIQTHILPQFAPLTR